MTGAIRREYLLRGVVQGVGFRPHVATVASKFPLTGLCGNDDLQVFVEAQAEASTLDAFLAKLLATLPPLARVIEVTSRVIASVDAEIGFRIVSSRHLPGTRTLIPPDVATCVDCLADMADPANRRHRYAFTTCTNCGPRLTIIEDLPYDRPATTMRTFEMCPACSAEYRDPTDRRFHAQPISCYDCGPRLWLARPGMDAATRPGPGGASPQEQAAVVEEARQRLATGEVVAVKGLGGFHLMCDARNAAAVGRLRERKRRGGKPFAVMVADTAAAASLANLTPPDLTLLASPARPIVIAPTAAGYDLATAVAPDSSDIGVMLPYTPLHSLLLEPVDGSALALVATSGNLSEEPLCHTNSDALTRLAGLADSFLLHDRDIHVPVEDSVMLALPKTRLRREPARLRVRPSRLSGVDEQSEEQTRLRRVATNPVRMTEPIEGVDEQSEDHSDAVPLRRSRGYAPVPLVLPASPDGTRADGPVVLAVGGELKNTFALASRDMVFVSAHIGDMGSLASQRAFGASVRQLVTIQREEPELVAHDLHPGYATTAWAERYADAHPHVRLVPVQHHFAHALALLAEHSIGAGPVVVAALDGTGYGDDFDHPGPEGPRAPTIWGGEVLVLGSAAEPSPWNWRRAWHVPTFPLVGGDRAVRHPWRVAQGLASAWHLEIGNTPASTGAPAAELRLVASQLDSGQGLVGTSSVGRLFDAAAAMLGVCLESGYEAHAAMLLERTADQWDGHRVLDPVPPDLCAVFADLLTGRGSVPERAWRFHAGLAAVFADRITAAAAEADTRTVGLTGGVAVNRVFRGALLARLAERNLRVLTHRLVPPNDGGLSLGQAWAGRLCPS